MAEELETESQQLSSLLRTLEAANAKDILGQTFIDQNGRRTVIPFTLVYGVDPAGALQELVDVNGRVPVTAGSTSDAEELGETPGTNVDAAVTITAGQIFEALEYVWSMTAAAVVATRAFSGNFTVAGRITALAIAEVQTSPVLTITISEPGQIRGTPENGRYITHDANIQALVTDGTPLPRYLFGSDTSSATSTNKDAGDRFGISILARRIA